MQHTKKKNNEKQNAETMYQQRNTNLPQMCTNTYKFNI